MFWPHTAFGVAVFGLLAGSWAAAAWAVPFAGGLLLAIPFCVLSADPRVSAWLRRGVGGGAGGGAGWGMADLRRRLGCRYPSSVRWGFVFPCRSPRPWSASRPKPSRGGGDVSYFATCHATGSLAARSYQVSMSGWARTASA